MEIKEVKKEFRNVRKQAWAEVYVLLDTPAHGNMIVVVY